MSDTAANAARQELSPVSKVPGIIRSAKLGADVVEKLKNTSLATAREQEKLIVLNRGAAPGEWTDDVRKLVDDAIAGKPVSAIAFTAELTGRQPPRSKKVPATPSASHSAVDEILNCAEASAAARRAAYAAEEQQLDAVCRNVNFSAPDETVAATSEIPKLTKSPVVLDSRAFDDAPLPERTKFLDAIGAKTLLAALPLGWTEAVREWLAIHDARPALSAPASNSDDLEIPLFPRRDPPRRLN
jgi:hypothetical protein